MRYWTLLVLAVAAAGCSPQITNLEVTSADGSQTIRTDTGLKVTTDVKKNWSSMQSPALTLSRTRPGGLDVPRPLVVTATNDDVKTHVATVAAGDNAVPLEQGSKWNARVTVPYTYGWSTETVTREVPFEVLEPAKCFGFVDSTNSPRWTLNGYFRNDQGNPVASITPEFFADANWPQPRDGDQSFGFRIQSFSTNGWATNDVWSAEFISPGLAGGNAFVPWGGIKHYKVWVRTDAEGLKLQAILTLLDTGGNPRVYRIVDANSQGVFWNLASDDAWHEFDVDFTPFQLAAGHVLTVSLRVFGEPYQLQSNNGKRVMIDQACRVM